MASPTRTMLSYLREFEHITLARVLLAQFRSDNAEGTFHQATAHLERLLRAAEEGGRTGGVIEILVLQALAAQLRGDVPAALVPLERALNLAEPEGYVQTFVGADRRWRGCWRRPRAAGSRPPSSGDYSRPWDKNEDRATTAQGLVDPLSDRERDVLRLLGTDLSGPRNRARARGLSQHRANAHEQHLHEIGCEQPPGSSTRRGRPRPVAANPSRTPPGVHGP